jgi:hypothetical protein
MNADVSTMTDAQKIEAFHHHVQSLYEKYPPGSEDHYLFGSLGLNEMFDAFNATQSCWSVLFVSIVGDVSDSVAVLISGHTQKEDEP